MTHLKFPPPVLFSCPCPCLCSCPSPCPCLCPCLCSAFLLCPSLSMPPPTSHSQTAPAPPPLAPAAPGPVAHPPLTQHPLIWALCLNTLHAAAPKPQPAPHMRVHRVSSKHTHILSCIALSELPTCTRDCSSVRFTHTQNNLQLKGRLHVY